MGIYSIWLCVIFNANHFLSSTTNQFIGSDTSKETVLGRIYDTHFFSKYLTLGSIHISDHIIRSGSVSRPVSQKTIIILYKNVHK